METAKWKHGQIKLRNARKPFFWILAEMRFFKKIKKYGFIVQGLFPQGTNMHEHTQILLPNHHTASVPTPWHYTRQL
ncbi:hypothetical protein BpHYR1_044094 [Brachionus plicatilis]|uniref:Uncharacterized protein n=1 Tax=Brachionus plicatilis TaxID=10195 RepID=A0A3M7RNW4_BRAPC|nr:hypothetical protein BpHYR1_044094 [Brachionus plicatilis]